MHLKSQAGQRRGDAGGVSTEGPSGQLRAPAERKTGPREKHDASAVGLSDSARAAHLPDPPVIPAAGLLLGPRPGCHHLVVREGHPVDPLQGFHSRVALPVRRGSLDVKRDSGQHIRRAVIHSRYVHDCTYTMVHCCVNAAHGRAASCRAGRNRDFF